MTGAGRLAGKVVVITGGAQGIGRVTAELAASEGATVAILDIAGDLAETAAESLRARGRAAMAVVADISVEPEVEAAFSMIAERGGVHGLVNNAAITAPDHQRRDGPVTETDVTTWDRSMAIDLRGTMLCCKHAVPHLVRSGGGSIVNTSSDAALAGDQTLTAYAAAKAGVNALTRSVATAFGPSGVRCNTISPGAILSPSARRVVPADVLAGFAAHTALGRMGDPLDVARATVFLLSDESSYITGEVLRVDGGWLSHLPHTGYL